MRISDIRPQIKNKNRYNLYIDGVFVFGVDAEIVYICNLKINDNITAEFIENIIKKEEQLKANNYAINIISRRFKTEKELTQKLKDKGYEDEVIINTIGLLKRYNYINDAEYTSLYFKDKLNLSMQGTTRIKLDLIKKGIPKTIIENYVEIMEDNDIEYENASKLAAKKYKNIEKEDENIIKRKIFGYLQRKGYSFEIINKVLKELY